MAKARARRRRNPKWGLDGVTIETDRDADGTWSYRTKVTQDDTEIDVGSGYATEDDALREAMKEAEETADYQHLREGHELWREPDYSAYGSAIWWGPGDFIEEVESVTVSEETDCVSRWDWIDEGYGWSKRTACPDPVPASHRLRAAVGDHMLEHWGGAEEQMSQEDFEEQFGGTIPSRSDAQGNPQHGGSPFQQNPSALEVIYDGRRRGRDMIYIEPWKDWGERAYGLSPREDDYTFERRVAVGDRTRIVVSDATYQRLLRQRETRISYRRAR